VRSIILPVEREDDGWFIVSDGVYGVDGDADSLSQAVPQYAAGLIDDYEFFLRELRHNPLVVPHMERMRKHIQPSVEWRKRRYLVARVIHHVGIEQLEAADRDPVEHQPGVTLEQTKRSVARHLRPTGVLGVPDERVLSGDALSTKGCQEVTCPLSEPVSR